MTLEGQNILIISNEPWGDIWYSKHNYANELSKKNKVFFLNPPSPFLSTKGTDTGVKEKMISDNLVVLEYTNVLPVSVLNLWKINDKLVLKRIKKYFENNQIKNLLFWTFDPIRLGFPEILNPDKIILHAVDDYKFTFKSEHRLANKANCIICVSDEIAVHYKNMNANVHVIPHAIPDDEFLPLNLNKNNPVTGVFIGKMDERINFSFNLEVFRSFPDVSFKLIGITDPELIELVNKYGLKNVDFVDPIKSSEIKNYVQRSDFCFIFKKIYIGNNISSHKLLQYLAQGKPIFGTDFSDMSAELKETLYLNNNVNEVKKMLTYYLEKGEPAHFATIRVNFAKQRTFSSVLKKIESLLEP